MAIILQDNFSSFDHTKWPTYVHSSGSYAVAGGMGTFSPGAGGLDSLGIVSQAFQWDAGTFCQFEMRPSAASGLNFIVSIATAGHSYGYNGTYGVYPDGGSPNTYAFDQNTSRATGYSVQAATWTTVKFVARGDFLIDLYLDGVRKDTSVNSGTGFETTGATMQLEFHIDQVNGSSGTLDIRNFVVDNDKTVQTESSASSGSGFSTLHNINFGVQTDSETLLSKHTKRYYRAATKVGSALSDYTAEASATTRSGAAGKSSTRLIRMGAM
jgi:hypothetical protein